MIVKRKDLDPAQVARMKGVYGMSDAQILSAAQNIVDPKARQGTNRTPPARRNRRARRY